VEVSFLVVRRRRVQEIRDLLSERAPGSFITLERVDRADGAVPVNAPDQPESRFRRSFFERMMPVRK